MRIWKSQSRKDSQKLSKKKIFIIINQIISRRFPVKIVSTEQSVKHVWRIQTRTFWMLRRFQGVHHHLLPALLHRRKDCREGGRRLPHPRTCHAGAHSQSRLHDLDQTKGQAAEELDGIHGRRRLFRTLLCRMRPLSGSSRSQCVRRCHDQKLDEELGRWRGPLCDANALMMTIGFLFFCHYGHPEA